MKFRRLPITSAQDTTQNFEQLQAIGAWVAPESFSTKLEGHGTLQVRLEPLYGVVRFKGFCQAKEEVPVLTVLFTLPPGFRPREIQRLGVIDVGANALNEAYVNPSGIVESREKTAVGHFFSFDGLTFPLT